MRQDHLSKQERKEIKQFRQQRKNARGRQYEAINYWNNKESSIKGSRS